MRPGAAPIRPRSPGATATRISHVHAKDVRRDVMERPRAERLELPRRRSIAGVYTVPGDGWSISGRARRAAGLFRLGVVEAEQDPEKAHPLTYAKMGYANLRRYLARMRALA